MLRVRLLLAGAVVLATSAIASPQTPEWAVYFIDMPNGDNILVDIGDYEILIDGGNSERDAEKFWREHRGLIDGKIDLMILTHADPDHVNGLCRIVTMEDESGKPMFGVREYWDPGYPAAPLRETHACVLAAMAASKAAIKRPLEDYYRVATKGGGVAPMALPGSDLRPDLFNITILHSDKAPRTQRLKCGVAKLLSCPDAFRLNNASVVVRLQLDGRTFLLTGDINGRVDKRAALGEVELLLVGLLEHHGDRALRSDVIKIPHHGSKTSSHPEFVCAVGADWAISTEHRYATVGLPWPSILKRYRTGPQNCRDKKEADVLSQARGVSKHIVCTAADLNGVVCREQQEVPGRPTTDARTTGAGN